MNADKTSQDHPEQTAYRAGATDTVPALTPHGGVMRVPRHRVVVMHGDEEIRRLIAISLTLEGFEVTTTAGGQDCLYKMRAADPDILITANANSYLPGEWVAGMQLCRCLANSRVKVLLINTALESEENPVASTRVDACLTAPFDPAEMIRTVRNLAKASQPGLQSANP